MEKLKIVNKNNYVYTLETENKYTYNMNLEFFDIERMPEIGNYIWMNEELLNSMYKGYSTNYTFGNLANKYGKENITLDDIDVIKLLLDEKEIYLKRLYG